MTLKGLRLGGGSLLPPALILNLLPHPYPALLPPQLLQPVARQRAVAFEVAVTAKKIGFLPGAGDDIPAALAQLGCTVTTLTGADLPGVQASARAAAGLLGLPGLEGR